jgi:hypothetical protein
MKDAMEKLLVLKFWVSWVHQDIGLFPSSVVSFEKQNHGVNI